MRRMGGGIAKIKALLRGSWLYYAYKRSIAWCAAWRHGFPARTLQVVGVTGTDGKTTTCTLIHWLLQRTGHQTLFVGTTGVWIGDTEVQGIQKMTSYDPRDLQRLLAQAVKQGCTHAVIEVSSHGLDQLRFLGVPFSRAVLTNLAPEHLDYHHTIEAYAAAKYILFDMVQKSELTKKAIILPTHAPIAHQRAQDNQLSPVTRYGEEANAHWAISDIQLQANKTRFTLMHQGTTHVVDMQLGGKFNVYNATAALAVVQSFGVTVEQALPALQQFTGVVGRQEHVQRAEIDWYIDFAHTPQGLENMLMYLRSITHTGKLRCLFGAPGLRDRFKRPQMGAVVDRLADIIVLTDDDADAEDHMQIIADVHAGISREQGLTYVVLPDRREAIAYVAAGAKAGDCVLLAGKGHEQVRVTNEGKIPRDEKTVLRQALERAGRMQ